MFAALSFPAEAASSLAGTTTALTSLRVTGRLISELLIRSNPLFCSFGSKASIEGLFMTITERGRSVVGDPTSSLETITVQLAVPPRISGPYEGIQVTFLPSFIAL